MSDKITTTEIDKVFEQMMETDASTWTELREKLDEEMRTLGIEVADFAHRMITHKQTPKPPEVKEPSQSAEELTKMSDTERQAHFQAVADAQKYLKWKQKAVALKEEAGSVAFTWHMCRTLELGIKAKAAAAAKCSGAAATSESVVPSPAFTFGTGPASGSPSQASDAAPGTLRMGSPGPDTVGADPAMVGGKRKREGTPEDVARKRVGTPDDMAAFRHLQAEAKKRKEEMKARREQRKANSNA